MASGVFLLGREARSQWKVWRNYSLLVRLGSACWFWFCLVCNYLGYYFNSIELNVGTFHVDLRPISRKLFPADPLGLEISNSLKIQHFLKGTRFAAPLLLLLLLVSGVAGRKCERNVCVMWLGRNKDIKYQFPAAKALRKIAHTHTNSRVVPQRKYTNTGTCLVRLMPYIRFSVFI